MRLEYPFGLGKLLNNGILEQKMRGNSENDLLVEFPARNHELSLSALVQTFLHLTKLF